MTQEGRSALRERICRAVDPRLQDALRRPTQASPPPAHPLGPHQHLVLAGQRAAGKTTLLPLLAEWTGRKGVDLDAEVEKRFRRPLRRWVQEDLKGFRAAERETFAALPVPLVVSVGGGFLSLHSDLLQGHLPVLIPISFETYRERLLASARRPRLRPELSLEDEISQVYAEREAAHAKVACTPLADFLQWDPGGSR